MTEKNEVIDPKEIPQGVLLTPSLIIHIGRPDECAPHRDLSKLVNLQKNSPKTHFMVVLWDKKDADELNEKLKAEKDIDLAKVSIYLWDDDNALLSEMLNKLPMIVGAQIVSPRWLICANRHETREDPQNPELVCRECRKAAVLMTPFIERMQEFAVIFGKALNLANFDTGSAHVLFSKVDPRRNMLLNMRYAFGKTQCKDLKGLGKGKTVYVIGAGPSLEDQIEDLKRLSETGIMIAVGRSYKMLREKGVKVHFTYSVEMFDWDAEIFKGLDDVTGTSLLYATVCAPETVEAWPGERICVWDAETGGTILKRDDWIVGGNSVAHHMLNFAAQILDADEIVLVGIDLAYTKPKTHADGTTPENWPKEQLEKDKAYHAEDFLVESTGEEPFHPECHHIQADLALAMRDGILNNTPIYVKSSPSYENFASLFQVLIDKHKKPVLNACPNGQKIKGTTYVNLAEYKK